MSIKMLSKVFEDTAMTPTQKLIMLAMADHAGDDGVCFPKIETLMKKTSLGRTAVVKNIKKAEEQGLLQKTIRAKKKGGRWSNIYLLFPSENYAVLDAAYLSYFTPTKESQSSPDGTELGKSQSSPDGTETLSQSSPDGTEHTIREPSLKNEPSLKSVTPAENVANFLLQKITAFNPRFSIRNINAWVDDIDKAIRLDNRDPNELLQCVEWIYSDKRGNFWIPNVLSGKKLRKNFDTMWMQSRAGNNQNKEIMQGLDLAERVRDAG